MTLQTRDVLVATIHPVIHAILRVTVGRVDDPVGGGHGERLLRSRARVRVSLLALDEVIPAKLDGASCRWHVHLPRLTRADLVGVDTRGAWPAPERALVVWARAADAPRGDAGHVHVYVTTTHAREDACAILDTAADAALELGAEGGKRCAAVLRELGPAAGTLSAVVLAHVQERINGEQIASYE